MKKLLFLILAVLALTFSVAGCGGGPDDTPHFLTAILHVVDNTGNGISGVKFVYSDPDGNQITTPASGADGIIRLTINKAGDYYITSYEFGGNHPLPTPYPIHVDSEDLDGGATDIVVTMDPVTGGISIDDGDDDDATHSATAYFYITDSDMGHPIAGVKFAYTDPDHNVITSPTSGSDGIIRLTVTKPGDYTIISYYYDGNHNLDTPYTKTVYQDDIDGNEDMDIFVTMDVVSKQIVGFEDDDD